MEDKINKIIAFAKADAVKLKATVIYKDDINLYLDLLRVYLLFVHKSIGAEDGARCKKAAIDAYKRGSSVNSKAFEIELLKDQLAKQCTRGENRLEMLKTALKVISLLDNHSGLYDSIIADIERLGRINSDKEVLEAELKEIEGRIKNMRTYIADHPKEINEVRRVNKYIAEHEKRREEIKNEMGYIQQQPK